MIRYVQFGFNQQENIFIHFPIDFHVEQSAMVVTILDFQSPQNSHTL